MTFLVLSNEDRINTSGTDGLSDQGTGTTAVSSGLVSADAYVYGTDNGIALNGSSTGSFNVIINGIVFGSQADGIVFSDATATQRSTLSLGVSGDIFGALNGVTANHAVSITNAGTIYGGVNGIAETTTDTTAFAITNAATGIISVGDPVGGTGAAILIAAGSKGIHTITNAGLVIGSSPTGGGPGLGAINTGDGSTAIDKVTNTGTLGVKTASGSGSVFLFGGNDSFANSGTVYGDVDMGDGTNTFSNSKTIAGTSSTGGVKLGAGSDVFSNTGSIDGSVVDTGGANTVTSTGTITGRIALGDGSDIVTLAGSVNSKLADARAVDLGQGANTLTITGGNIVGSVTGGSGNDTIKSAATISGYVDLGDGANTFGNSKNVFGFNSTGSGLDRISVLGGAGNDTANNSGTIFGAVSLGDGVNSLTNSGMIQGIIFDEDATQSTGIGVNFGAGSDTLVNSKTIAGGIDLGSGSNKLTNSGAIYGIIAQAYEKNNLEGVSIQAGAGADVVVNSGTINGGVDLGGGNDSVTNTGKILGAVLLGLGADTFVGGAVNDYVQDDGGADKISLGGSGYLASSPFDFGNAYMAIGAAAGTDGIDTIDGGTGLGDAYAAFIKDGAAATNSVYINLDTVAHKDDLLAASSKSTVDKNTALGIDVSGYGDVTLATTGVVKDVITGFEFAAGGEAGDLIFGSAAANILYGDVLSSTTGGDDVLYGYAGADTIVGGAGIDTIVGGAGHDVLYGGSYTDGVMTPDGAANVFAYGAVADSGITAATRDVIMDFQTGSDFINLTALEAATSTTAHFSEGNVSFDGTSGDIRAIFTSSSTIVQLDLQGDGKADFSIELKGHLTLTASNFQL